MHPLIQAWREFPIESAPFSLTADNLPTDDERKCATYLTYNEFVASKDFEQNPSKLHLGLLPQPFIGHLESASVFVLMLNPGFSPGDYYALHAAPGYRQCIERNLRQQNGQDDFPFFYLNPVFAWTAGGRWWQSKLKSIAQALVANNSHLSYQEALQHISKNLACLELYPYASNQFSKPNPMPASAKLMQAYVHDIIVPRVLAGNATVIVTRQKDAWGLPEYQGIISYSAGEARGAHISMNTSGGKAIAALLQSLI